MTATIGCDWSEMLREGGKSAKEGAAEAAASLAMIDLLQEQQRVMLEQQQEQQCTMLEQQRARQELMRSLIDQQATEVEE